MGNGSTEIYMETRHSSKKILSVCLSFSCLIFDPKMFQYSLAQNTTGDEGGMFQYPQKASDIRVLILQFFVGQRVTMCFEMFCSTGSMKKII